MPRSWYHRFWESKTMGGGEGQMLNLIWCMSLLAYARRRSSSPEIGFIFFFLLWCKAVYVIKYFPSNYFCQLGFSFSFLPYIYIYIYLVLSWKLWKIKKNTNAIIKLLKHQYPTVFSVHSRKWSRNEKFLKVSMSQV